MEKVKAEAGQIAASLADDDQPAPAAPRPTSVVAPQSVAAFSTDGPPRPADAGNLRAEVDALRHELASLRQTIAQFGDLVEQAQREVRELRASLGG